MVKVNDKIYCASGYDNGFINSVEIYDIEKDLWCDGPSMVRKQMWP